MKFNECVFFENYFCYMNKSAIIFILQTQQYSLYTVVFQIYIVNSGYFLHGSLGVNAA